MLGLTSSISGTSYGMQADNTAGISFRYNRLLALLNPYKRGAYSFVNVMLAILNHGDIPNCAANFYSTL